MAVRDNKKTWHFPEDVRLFKLGYWAGVIGWGVLVFGVAQVAMTFIRYHLTGGIAIWVGGETLFEIIPVFLSAFSPLTSAFFIWFMLQAVKQLLYAMVDVKELLSDGKIASEE